MRSSNYKKWVVLLVLAAGAGAIFLMCTIRNAGRSQPECDSNCSINLASSGDLARHYAPILQLKDQARSCDKAGEAFNPSAVEAVLGNPGVALHRPGGVVLWGPNAADLFDAGYEAFLDLPGNPKTPGCKYELDARSYAADHTPVTYSRLSVDREAGKTALQYWFFYYFNDWTNRHEGDWEFIQLIFEAGSIEDAMRIQPSEVGYSQHRGGESASWDDSKLRREGDRPVVYVARGSHANHFGPHTYLGRGEERTGVGCEDARAPLRTVAPDVVLIPEGPVDDAGPFAWLAYRGSWGEQAGGEFDGPGGPNLKRAWSYPIEWQESLRHRSIRIPGSLVGPNAANIFCDVLTVASHNLLALAAPLRTVAVSVLIVLLVVAAVALSRTTYWPLGLSTLRTRRSIGQVLLTSFFIMVRGARTFLVVGLLFIPLGALTSGLEYLALTVSPLAGITSFETEAPGQRVLLLVSFGQVQLNAAFWLVAAGCVTALALEERLEPMGIRPTIRRTLLSLPALVAARVLSLIVIFALAATIVAIPFALRQAVRWAFLEQAILLERRSILGAFRDSATVAQGRWWWSLGSIGLLAGLGFIAVPAIGLILILAFKSLPLTYVNLLTSVIYVAVGPYLAIALTLVYTNLKALASQVPET